MSIKTQEETGALAKGKSAKTIGMKARLAGAADLPYRFSSKHFKKALVILRDAKSQQDFNDRFSENAPIPYLIRKALAHFGIVSEDFSLTPEGRELALCGRRGIGGQAWAYACKVRAISSYSLRMCL